MQLWQHFQNRYYYIVNTIVQYIKQQLHQKRQCTSILRWVLTTTVFGIITFFTFFGIDFNPQIMPKFDTSRTDPGLFSNPTCFSNSSVMYNKVNKHVGMIPSVPVAQDDICYEYAGLIRTFEYISVDDNKGNEQMVNITTLKDHDMSTVYHTFWSTSYSKQFTENQLSTLRSFIATQRRHKHVLYFWILEKDQHALIHGNSLWNTTQQFHNNIIQLKIVEENLTMNSAVSQLIENSNDDNYIESLLRMISLYEYGGIWFDLDVLFIRDLTPLLHQEWTTQSSCSESSSFFTQRRYKVDNRFKGSLMHFRKHSPFLCEMLSIVQAQMSTKSSAEMHIPNYREYLYQLVFYRVLKHHLTPWAVLPWCFTNPSQCRKSNSLPSLFDHKKISEKNSQRLSKTFVQSYYRNWYRSPGTVFIELINQHKSITKW